MSRGHNNYTHQSSALKRSGHTDVLLFNPVVVVLDFKGGLSAYQDSKAATSETDKLHDKLIITNPPSNTACGDPAFGVEDGHITFVATDVMPRRYGLCECSMRNSPPRG